MLQTTMSYPNKNNGGRKAIPRGQEADEHSACASNSINQSVSHEA
jgi:hypothetical protein